MGFAGNLQTLSLSEVMQTLNRIRATGVLRMASGSGGRDVVFDAGQIIGVVFRKGEERSSLLRRLILTGKIGAEEAAAISSAGTKSRAIIDSLLERKVLETSDVEDTYRQQQIDELYNLWTWDHADFVFQDASPEDPDSTALVERCRGQPLQVNLNQLLMDSVRRMDEWEVLQRSFDDHQQVPGLLTTRQAELEHAGLDYPASAVLPLIDGVRSIEEIVRDTIATRLDVYSVLAMLFDRGLATVLEQEQLRESASGLHRVGDHARAAQLYRKLLAVDPEDQAVLGRLGECLEQLGDAPEAAGCYAQMALGHLGAKEQGQAVDCARKAVELAPGAAEQRLVLVRCLMGQGSTAEAVRELLALADVLVADGLVEDARNTCLKVLQIEPANEDARRVLARLFSDAGAKEIAADVAVCVACGTANERRSAQCSKCQAPLHLSCRSCDRVISVSDRLCIFCGADPNGTRRLGRKGTDRIDTDRLIDVSKVRKSVQEKGSSFWKSKIQGHARSGKEHEAAGNLEQALHEWREIAAIQTDNSDLTNHIRGLESRIHDLSIERQIERGHLARKGRRFYSAIRAYRAALRTMAVNDPRVAPLNEILAVTRRHCRRITAMYAASLLIILLVGVAVAKPHVDFRRYAREIAAAGQRLADASAMPGAESFAPVDAEVAALEARLAGFGNGTVADKARGLVSELRGNREILRQRAAESELGVIDTTLAAKRADDAQRRLERFRQVFGGDFLPLAANELDARLQRLRKEQVESERLRQDAPARLAEAKASEQQGRLGQALRQYRALQQVGAADIAGEAAAAAARLAPQSEAVAAQLAAAGALAATDLAKARTALEALAAPATVWDLVMAREQAAAAVAQRLAEAETAYRALGEGSRSEAIEAYIAAHPGAPQLAQARARLAQLRSAGRSRSDALDRYRAAMESKSWEQAWKAGMALRRDFPGDLRPGDAPLPLVLESAPAGVAVLVGGERRGVTPLIITYEPGTPLDLRLTMPGYLDAARTLPVEGGPWRLQLRLERERLWTAALAKHISLIAALSGGGLVVNARETLFALDRGGQPAWQLSVVSGDELIDQSKVALHHQPLELADGRLVLGLADRGLLVVDAQGRNQRRLPTKGLVSGRPAVYVNELLGSRQRLAFAAEDLVLGDLDGEAQRVPLDSPALSGPLVVAKDLDRLLVIATLDGRLQAIEDGSHRRLWAIDLAATEIGQLVPTGDGGLVTVLDGSRLACYSLAGSGATLRWTTRLSGQAHGLPQVAGEVVHLAVGSTVLRTQLSGVALPPWTLPSPASTGLAASGDILVAGCRDGDLVVFKAGKPLWTSPCPAAVTALCISGGTVVAGCADGTLIAFNL